MQQQKKKKLILEMRVETNWMQQYVCEEKIFGFYCTFMVAVYPPRGMGESRGSSQHM